MIVEIIKDIKIAISPRELVQFTKGSIVGAKDGFKEKLLKRLIDLGCARINAEVVEAEVVKPKKDKTAKKANPVETTKVIQPEENKSVNNKSGE